MGNAMALCFYVNYKASTSSSSSSLVKLIFWEGKTITFKGKKIAGEIMFEYPEMMVCHANSFYINHIIPALSISDELFAGQTYFILPIDPFAFKVLSISSLSSLASSSSGSKPKRPINFTECPFQYVKGSDGRMLIRVLPEFIMKLISTSDGNSTISSTSSSTSFLCSTPELKKHYDVLVGSSKERVWSPKLETVSECKKNVAITTRLSPCRLLGVDVRRSTVRLTKSN
ncbi:uncharacterized protein LOC113312851 [Papaver somniferum]|uniref:uncharacterized protein LOC113312851 n=1 Tax=Papaver somniferum TaxID=3469 RepID=UPI000E6FE489|nr:uncharacterized protein LOC113312851 [Papaver somniferum]